jgi:hypothetical protein
MRPGELLLWKHVVQTTTSVTNPMTPVSHLCIIFLALALVHPKLIQRTHANDPSHAPTSERTHPVVWAHLMTAWFGGRWDALMIKTERMQITCRTEGKIRKSKLAAEIMQLPPEPKKKGRVCLVFAASAMRANGTDACKNSIAFDADSDPVGIDNGHAASVSHRIEDFEGQLVDSNRSTMGAIKWKWSDNDGEAHKFIAPKSCCVPDGKARLLSPQLGPCHENGWRYHGSLVIRTRGTLTCELNAKKRRIRAQTEKRPEQFFGTLNIGSS